MHTKPLTLARKIFIGLLAVLGLFLLTGCDMTLTNLTPSSLAENPSQIYTLSLRVKVSSGAISKSSVHPIVIVGGKSFPMNKSSLGEDLFDFDYQAPAGTDQLKYYFLVQYNVVDANSQIYANERYTEVYTANVARRYVLSLEVTRGPVGARVSVLGRGFSPQDVIYFDNVATRTVYDSANSLSFFVPAVEANRNYRVSLSSANGNSPVGTFRVDTASVTVSPTMLSLRPGQKQTLTFSLPYPASAGGVLLDVTTDVPESVIMPEVVVPAGQSSVSIPVQGGKKGSGTLFLKGFGQGEISIPVSVQ